MACSSLPGGLLQSTSRSTSSAWLQIQSHRRPAPFCFSVRAVVAPEDCNEEDCAPEKEMGKVSLDWRAAESSKVSGTYPPVNRRKWTGYVEKDTAGQTNIYAVEPTVYVSENVISSNTSGDSSSGSEKTLLVAGGLALGLLVGAAVVLQGVNTSSPSAQITSSESYSGPDLSYYIQKFSPTPTVVADQASVPVEAPSVSSNSIYSQSQSE